VGAHFQFHGVHHKPENETLTAGEPRRKKKLVGQLIAECASTSGKNRSNSGEESAPQKDLEEGAKLWGLDEP